MTLFSRTDLKAKKHWVPKPIPTSFDPTFGIQVQRNSKKEF